MKKKKNSPVMRIETVKFQIHEWLAQHGGRLEKDINLDEEGKKYVWMGSGDRRTKVKVYIPEFKDNEIWE